MDSEREPAQVWSIHRRLTIALQTIIVVGLAFSVYERQWLNTLVIASILLLTILPALFLGETRDYYNRYWWWDIALHTTSGGLLGILGLLLVYVLNETPRVDLHMRPGFVACFAFCFAVAVGAVWEVFEFAMDGFFAMNMQKPMFDDPSGLTDTMWDLIVDTLGALVISAVLASVGTRAFWRSGRPMRRCVREHRGRGRSFSVSNRETEFCRLGRTEDHRP